VAGALIFGLAFHFLVSGPDNVFTLHVGAVRKAFSVSAVLVALNEGIGCLVGIWALSKLPHFTEGAGGKVYTRRSSGEEVR